MRKTDRLFQIEHRRFIGGHPCLTISTNGTFLVVLTVGLFAVGLIGTVLPVFPGTIIILAGAIIHRIMLGPDKSIGWQTIVVLVLLTLATYALDFLSGYFGAKYFGATRWGMLGAILGALVGIFFGVIGLFVGPVIGAILGEFIAGKRMIDAGGPAGGVCWETSAE